MKGLWEFAIEHWSWALVAGAALIVGRWILQRILNVLNPGTEALLGEQVTRFQSWRRARRMETKRKRTALARASHIKGLEQERIGQRFLRREEAASEGVIGVVVSLDEQSPETKVLVAWAETPGREPNPETAGFGQRTVIDWRSLTQPEGDQKHINARVVLKSFNDEDGWVTFEQLPPRG